MAVEVGQATSIFLFIFIQFVVSVSHTQRCSYVYKFSPVENIEYYNLYEMVKVIDSGYSGIHLQGGTFKVRNFSKWSEVSAFYANLPLADRRILTKIILSRSAVSADLHQRLVVLALKETADLTYRAKQIDSLREKIFDRINIFAKNNSSYKISDLADVIGFRLEAPAGSGILKLHSQSEWAKVLNIDESKILEVEIKGSENDIQKGRYYSAIHLNIMGSDGQNFEIQVMSKPMGTWHTWDHIHVYKSKNMDHKKVERLKKYSVAWAKIIIQKTLSVDRLKSDSQILVFLQALGLGTKNNLYDFDRRLKQIYHLTGSEGFSARELEKIVSNL